MLNEDFKAYDSAMAAPAASAAPIWFRENLKRTLNSRNVTIEAWNEMCSALRNAASSINTMDTFIRKIYNTLPANVSEGDFIIVKDNKLTPIQLEVGGKY